MTPEDTDAPNNPDDDGPIFSGKDTMSTPGILVPSTAREDIPLALGDDAAAIPDNVFSGTAMRRRSGDRRR